MSKTIASQTKQFIPTESQTLDVYSKIEKDKAHVQVSHSCLNSCVSTYKKTEITGNERDCLNKCFYNHYENQYLGSITK